MYTLLMLIQWSRRKSNIRTVNNNSQSKFSCILLVEYYYKPDIYFQSKNISHVTSSLTSPIVFITDTVISVHMRKKTICFGSSGLFDLCVGQPEATQSRTVTCEQFSIKKSCVLRNTSIIHGGVQLAPCLCAGQAGVEGERKQYFGTILFFLKISSNARANSGMGINIT